MSFSALEIVAADTTDQEVSSIGASIRASVVAPRKPVIAGSSDDHIIARSGFQFIVPKSAKNEVVTPTGCDFVVSAFPVDFRIDHHFLVDFY
jgi:hypothetical protein